MIPRVVANSDDRGQILLLTALSMVVILGVAALSLDASFMYDKRNRLHAAADAAAKSGALEVHRFPSVTNPTLEKFADQQVAVHGFVPTRQGGTTTVIVNHPPSSGAFAGNSSYVEVIASEPTSTFLGVVLGRMSMTPTARAVAGTSAGPYCIITLGGPTANPESLSIGNSTITMPGCSVAVGGDLDATNPNSTINAFGTAVTGACIGHASACSSNMNNMTTSAPPPTDPLASLTPPTNPGGCAPAPGAVGGVLNLVPGCYSSIIFGNNTTVNLASGIYYLTGPFLTGNSPTVIGTGVMFYLAGSAATATCNASATAGCFNIANHANFQLSAPTSGPYNGVLFYQDPANHLNAEFDGNNPSYNLSGAMYFPGADVSFRNGIGASNDCMIFVARSLLINNGNGSFSNTCSAFGGSPILTVSLAE